MGAPCFFPLWWNAKDLCGVPRAPRHKSGVDAKPPPAYIGAGPRLPNEALSFWKE
jgi:hypothetical protein